MTAGPRDFKYDLSMAGGQPPPAFDLNLLPEASEDGVRSWREAMERAESFFRRVFTYLDGARAPYARRRKIGWNYYFMEDSGRSDRNRLASVFDMPGRFEDDDAEKVLDRAAVLHPVIYEAIQHLKTRIIDRMFGRAPQYVEVVGREKNDFHAARAYEALANYQQDILIPTADLADAWTLRALVDGAGYLFRTWDPLGNCPMDSVLDPDDYWADPGSRQRHLDRWNIVRRKATVGEMLQGRAIGMFWFSDDDLVAAVGSATLPGGVEPRYTGIAPSQSMRPDALLASQDYQARQIDLDILMQREGVDRWVYRANGLMVSVRPNPIPPGGPNGLYRYPVVEFSPVVEPACRYPRSMTHMMLYAQDMVNSISHLMMGNMAKFLLGVTFAGNDAFHQSDDTRLSTSAVNRVSASDPSKSILHVQFPDGSPSAMNAIGWLQNRVADQTSGVTETLRGQAVSKNETAFSTGTYLDQANARLEDIMRRARQSVRDYHMIGLMLNQRYLEPGTMVRIAGKEPVWRGVSREDIAGVAGYDIVPTGYPASAASAQFVQSALNTVMAMNAIGVDPKPFFREYMKTQYGGIFNVDAILPEPGEPGHDPVQENEQMANGMPVTTTGNDDDQRHIGEHLNFLIYLASGGAPQEVGQAVQGHLMEHVARYQQAMAQQGMGGMGPGGQPGGQAPAPDMADNAGGVKGLPRGLGMPGQGLSLLGSDPKRMSEIFAQVMGQQGRTA